VSLPVSRFISTPRAATGREAAERLVKEQVSTLRVIARGLYRDRADADDLVQDVLERALRALDQMDLDSNPRGWMVTILHNLHIDRCRRQARRGTHIPAQDVALVAEETAPEPVWAGIGVDDLRAGVEQLPDELRTVYRMFALEGRSYNDVAETLGIPKATVGTRLARARARLKELLTKKLGTSSA
jgi:RNA polymerase sigma-70 factor (ECF subfamily)